MLAAGLETGPCTTVLHVVLLQDCDPALLRRFSRRIEVPLPDTPAREAFFQAMLSRPEIESDLSTDDISTLAQCTQGYSGSDLADLCRTAALAPVRELMKQQRQQRGRKRRRLGLSLELPSSICRGSEQSEGSCAAASTPAAESASQQAALQTGCVAAGENSGAGFAADRQAVGQAPVQLRALVLSDFKAALELVKPAAVDAGAAAG
jgi:SpoVK/Ycf46/Vps4 family AAA+-type ATPase